MWFAVSDVPGLASEAPFAYGALPATGQGASDNLPRAKSAGAGFLALADLLLSIAMAYRRDLAKSARRHFEAATHLNQPGGRKDIAGYLYGIAAECALKEIMRQHGLRPRQPEPQRDDPFYLHFPALKTALRDEPIGRHQSVLHKYAKDPKLMQEWDIQMRYAPSADVLEKPIDEWAAQAKQLVEEMGTL